MIYKVNALKLNTKEGFVIQIEADEGETDETIRLSTQIENQTITTQDECYFSAFQTLRDALLQFGYGIQCNGASINAVQSAMMSYTPKIYLVEMGKQAFKKDIVNLYDFADISVFPDTKEQTAFLKKWVSSLG